MKNIDLFQPRRLEGRPPFIPTKKHLRNQRISKVLSIILSSLLAILAAIAFAFTMAIVISLFK